MQQEIQVNQPADRLLAEGAAFFAKRRAKVSERTERGFRFGLEGGDDREGGRVTVAPARGGSTTVTVQVDGLGVLAIAEGYVRELRKQARDAHRQGRSNAGMATLSSGFTDLRQRLGMPRPPPRRERVEPRPGPAPAAVSFASAAESLYQDATEGDTSPPGTAQPVPDRSPAATGGDVSATAGQAGGHESPAAGPPTAEQLGGVPSAAAVEQRSPETAETPQSLLPDEARPADAQQDKENPPGQDDLPGMAAGKAAPPER